MDDDYMASNATDTDMGEWTQPPDDLSSSQMHPFVAWIFGMMQTSNIFMDQVIIVKVIAFFSGMGSLYIMSSMVRRKKLDRTFDRLLLALSLSDFVSSIAYFLGSWSIPATPPPGFEDSWNMMFPQAAGNMGTCTAQGFFLFVGFRASMLFTGCIAVSSLLQVKFRFTKAKMRIAEYFFFGISIAFPLLGAVFILVDRGFNPNPLGYCIMHVNMSLDGVVTRGAGTTKHLLAFQTVPNFLVLFTIIVCMGMLFMTVRTQEQRTKRFSMSGPANSGKHQKRVLIKSILYVCGLLPTITVLVVGLLAVHNLIPYNQISLMYAYAIFLPIQGIFNVLIYSDFFNVFKEQTASITESIRSSTINAMEKFRSSTRTSSIRTPKAEKRTSIPTAELSNFDSSHNDEESCMKTKAMDYSSNPMDNSSKSIPAVGVQQQSQELPRD